MMIMQKFAEICTVECDNVSIHFLLLFLHWIEPSQTSALFTENV